MTSPVGLHRVIEPFGVLPQAALRLDNSADIGPDEVRIAIERLNLDAASFRQLATKHANDGEAVRAEVLDIWAAKDKNPSSILMVSHDIKEVAYMADRIVVLEGGRIAEEGNHKQLLSLGGRYSELFELQAASYR